MGRTPPVAQGELQTPQTHDIWEIGWVAVKRQKGTGKKKLRVGEARNIVNTPGSDLLGSKIRFGCHAKKQMGSAKKNRHLGIRGGHCSVTKTGGYFTSCLGNSFPGTNNAVKNRVLLALGIVWTRGAKIFYGGPAWSLSQMRENQGSRVT